MALSEQTRNKISQLLSEHEVVLFMKGNRRQPRCGFSATVVQILEGVGATYKDVDVLSDPALRDGIKEFGNWPTIPQLYYQGSLIGGCDIVRELDESGELPAALGLGAQVAAVAPPRVHVGAAAAAMILQAAAQAEPGQRVRIVVQNGGRSHDLMFDHQKPGDLGVEAGGVTFLFDRASARQADGLSIEFVETPDGGGFRIDNPNAPAQVRSLTPAELQARLSAREPLRLVDVRGTAERAIATLPGALALGESEDAMRELSGLPKDTMLVFYCHHGIRSQAAAEHFAQQGYRNVWNLRGGIEAWAQSVDPSMRRY